MRRVRIKWEGPFSVEEALRLNHVNNDYGLYQVYGRRHVIFGAGSLLCLGMARDQTFGQQIQQHDAEWLREEEEVSIRVGRMVSEDYAHEPPDWPDWCQVLAHTEAFEIYWHSPPYNSSNISEYKGQPLRIVNEGERGSLVVECASDLRPLRPKDTSEEGIPETQH